MANGSLAVGTVIKTKYGGSIKVECGETGYLRNAG